MGCSDTSNNREDADNAEAAPEVEDVPALSEIEELMWDSMEDAGSVTITVDLSSMDDLDSEGVAIFGELVGADQAEFSLYGDLDGSATAVGIGDRDFIMAFGGEEAYISADAFFGILGSQGLGLGADEDEVLSELSEEFSGIWLDYSSDIQSDSYGDEFNMGALFSSLRGDWASEGESADTPVDRDELSDEGSHEMRDDADVWVYTGEDAGQELTLAADHDAPRIVELSDGNMVMAFTGWGETETPEAPDEADVMTEQQLEERLMGAMMGGGFDEGDTGTSD